MSLAFIGDFGNFSKQFVSMVKNHHFKHLYLIGDNFYPTLESSRQLETARETFKGVSRKLIHPVLGNHDWEGDVSRQLDFKGWLFPHFYYFTRPSRDVGVWMIDTQILDPTNDMFDLREEIKDATSSYTGTRKLHLEWLKKSLEDNKDCKIKIMCGHYPLVSAGTYPTNNTLIKLLCPLMKKYKIGTYISGHDHSTQHLEYIYKNHKIDQFVVGYCGDHTKYPRYGSTDAESKFFDDKDAAYLKFERGSFSLRKMTDDTTIYI